VPSADSAGLDRLQSCGEDLASLWERNLGTRVGAHDNYFDMGGDSLLGTQLLAWIRQQFGVELSLLDLFERPTVAAQARLLEVAMEGDRSTAARSATDYFFFDTPQASLFGALHGAADPEARSAVVLCYPIGQEYMRVHRTYVELARSLAAAGQHVLRFDYFGTGDSEGDTAEGTLARWRDDIRAALREVRSLTPAVAVHLVGSRVGANLALQAAAGADVASLVLWEPVVSGEDYVAILQRAHRDLLDNNAELAGYDQRELPGCRAEFVGFPFNSELYDELAGIDLLDGCARAVARDVLVLANSDKPGLRAFAAELATEGRRPDFLAVEETDGIWLKEDRENKGLIPARAIQAVVSWISERRQ
jgi:pimeloyl-ACP methyl ester carboxylesterase